MGNFFVSEYETNLRENILADYKFALESFKTPPKYEFKPENTLILDLDKIEDSYRVKLFNYWEWPDIENEKYRLETIGIYYRILHRTRKVKDSIRQGETDIKKIYDILNK
jgi:hypothetical protein